MRSTELVPIKPMHLILFLLSWSFFYVFIWLDLALVVAHRIQACGIEVISPALDLNHSTAREVPLLLFPDRLCPAPLTPPLDRSMPPSSVSFPLTTYGTREPWWKFMALRTARRINFCRWWNCLMVRICDADDRNQSTRLHIWHML